MSIRRSLVCLLATLWCSACAVEGVTSSPEVDVDGESDALKANVCTDARSCPVTRIACRLCPDGSFSCPEPQCIDGRCSQRFPECPPFNPCGGKACGDQCHVCPPNSPRCIETAVVKFCQPDGSCSPVAPQCEAIDKCAAVLCPTGTQCEDGQCIPNERVFCGGIAGFPCPGGGKCIDDPSDDCDPNNGGADCGGLCICPASAVCKAGTHWDPAPSVCACVPDQTEKVFCGGFAGIPCPGAGKCVDDPSDDCDPKNGGSDCGGLCICPPSGIFCKVGTHWDPSPGVCACVPGVPCGNRMCGADQICCSPSCGICGSAGGFCPAIACVTPLE